MSEFLSSYGKIMDILYNHYRVLATQAWESRRGNFEEYIIRCNAAEEARHVVAAVEALIRDEHAT